MKLNSISFYILAWGLFISVACSKKTTAVDPGRTITTVPTDTTGSTTGGTTSGTTTSGGTTSGSTTSGDITVVNDTRGGGTTGTSTGGTTTTTTTTSSNVLLTTYPNTIPTTKVCPNVLQSPDVSTLQKFFNWDITGIEGPVTVCIEQQAGTPTCPNGESLSLIHI